MLQDFSVLHPLLHFPHIPPLHTIQIPQHSLNRPDKPLFQPPRPPILNRNQILHERHAHIRANARQNMPPAMQLKQEPPRQPNIPLQCSNIAAQMKINIPQKVPKQARGNAKRRHALQLPPTLFALDLLLNQLPRLPRNQENHSRESDLVHVDLIRPDMVDGDGNHGAEDEERVLASLRGRGGLETEQLVQDGADGKEHAEVVAHLAVVFQGCVVVA